MEQQCWESRRALKQRKGVTITALECTQAFHVCRGAPVHPRWSIDEHLREEFPEAGKTNSPPHQNEIILKAHPKPGTLQTLAIESEKLPNSQASGRYSRSGNNHFQTKGCSGLTQQSQPCKNPTPSSMPEPVLWAHPIPLGTRNNPWDFPTGLVLLPMQRTWVQSLVRELRSHKLCGNWHCVSTREPTHPNPLSLPAATKTRCGQK